MSSTPQQQQQQQITPEVLLARAQGSVQSFGQRLRHPDIKLPELLSIADKLLEELRTNELSPKLYYELFLQVMDNLRFLQTWFAQHEQEMALVDLYQRVQYSTHVVPRMYLMLTVGACYIRGSHASGGGKDVMRDMLEMCKGVQNPLRGLFLRHYLAQVVKDHVAPVLGGSAMDQAEFLLQNFGEMARLWMRMMKKEEEGAKQLGQLVGQNLTRLGEFPLEVYCDLVLPKVAQLCAASEVEYVQSYLLDVLVNSFPLEFLFHTLDSFLQLVATCQESVRQEILCSVLDRFQNEEEDQNGTEGGARVPAVFEAFSHMFAQKQLGGGPLLLKLIELVQADEVKRLQLFDLASQSAFSNRTEVVRVIDLAFAKPERLTQVLQYPSIAKLFAEQLDATTQHLVATDIVLTRVVESTCKLSSVELARALFAYFPTSDSLQQVDAKLLARLVFRFENEENAQQLLDCLLLVQNKLEQVHGEEEFKLALMMPVCFRVMEVARRLPETARDVLQIVFTAYTRFAEQHMSNATRHALIKLFAQLALQADALQEDSVSYECMVSALSLFEEEPDSKIRVHLVPILIGTVQQLRSYSRENLDIMQTKVALYSAQLLRKQDQARCLAESSTLFWNTTNSTNGKRALECLQRAGKTCARDLAIQVDLLNHYIALYQAGADKVKASHLNEILTHVRALHEDSTINAGASAEAYYQRTLQHLRALAQVPGSRLAEFASI